MSVVRTTRSLYFLGVLAACSTLGSVHVRGQEEPVDPVLLEEIDADLRQGKLEAAEELLTELASESPSDPALAVLHARYLVRRGRYEQALLRLEAAAAGTPPRGEVFALRGEAHLRRGDYEAAERDLRAAWDARPRSYRGAFLLGECLREQGRRAEARAHGQAVVAESAKEAPRAPADLVELGRSLQALQQYQPASECYADALRADPRNADARAALGELNRLVYNDTDGYPSARPDLEKALSLDALHPEANFALFVLYGENFRRDREKRGRWRANLVALDPRHVPLALREAEELLRDRRFEDALKRIEDALAVQPRSRRALALRAAHAFARGDRETFARLESELLARDPSYGELYAILGRTLVDLYRFPEAVAPLQRAVELDPSLVEAHILLGQALANSGRHAQGLRALLDSREALPGIVHPWRENMITALAALSEEYVVRPHGDFLFYLQPQSAPVLEEYLPPIYERALAVLSEKYGIKPPLPVHVQVFDAFDDFSARTVGFTGFGALGVCFGNTITAVAPAAREFRGKFCWMSTAWHEFAHVITIALSGARIPRWLTEGVSTYEEKQLHPGYDRHLELELVDAYENGDIYPVERLNEAFRTNRIIFGYYQGGLICEYLAGTYDFKRIAQMIRLYGEDRSTEEVFRTCFELTPAEFDRRFLAFVKEKIAPIRVVPNLRGERLARLMERVRDDPRDAAAGELLAWQHFRAGRLVDAELVLGQVLRMQPEHGRAWLLKGQMIAARQGADARAALERGFAAGGEEFGSRLLLGRLLEREGDLAGAEAQYRAAALAFPGCGDQASSPHLQLFRLLRGQEGRAADAYAELERYCEIDGAAFEPRRRLAAWKVERQDWAAADRLYREANFIDPFSRELHLRWSRVLERLGREVDVRRELRVARSFDPSLDLSTVAPPSPDEAPEADAPWGIPGVSDDAIFRAETQALEAESWLREGQREAARSAASAALKVHGDCARAQALLKALGN
ncbi:MAG: tetratricopeptide repeat protein [Planctomycetes bacterium]|nr:tetratricopeptide repeat protein [Planctomycetota bacterium]